MSNLGEIVRLILAEGGGVAEILDAMVPLANVYWVPAAAHNEYIPATSNLPVIIHPPVLLFFR